MKNLSLRIPVYFFFIGAVTLITPVVSCAQTEAASPPMEIGGMLQYGYVLPEKVTPASAHPPVGVELALSRLQTTQRAWQQCNCFFRAGGYLNYYSFRNPQALGHSVGAGAYMEPLLWYRPAFSLSVRLSLGISYVSKIYDPLLNPNRNFGSHPNGMTGVGVYARRRLSGRWAGVLSLEYRHLSNAGVWQPNQGLNVPSVGVGLVYGPPAMKLPDPQAWGKAPMLSKRWFGRAVALASVRVMAARDAFPERSCPMFGVNLLGGYRLTKAHALSTGVELLNDGYMKEELRRGGSAARYQQATWLAGYELWQGRMAFTAHFGWNVVRPGAAFMGSGGYRPSTYQKYGLLYVLHNGLTMGIVVKAFGENTKGFQLAVGGSF
ncbi:acyloxyacyl hydrolase [Runella slithyformis]|uniref:Lipid A 3-O-deacylase-related protein n=1 Tax=Runella slithyformis (strain ATCC 29530 / DSM 19594 / LMG 11500 / NCIMB 11436 / LSU 4) TaxID=761193 RepID=A0A7U3ZPJ5_RUNSL|nr:acyloxyacyl hydrolase [Runella slithyformis]AEI51000.1 Lipid A 3-O-deacylase-related protein [Runella slithyformis DSM 19594]